MTPQPTQVQATFSAGVEALRRIEQARQAREDRMRNALEILADTGALDPRTGRSFAQFVRATAREGLGRESGERGAA